MDSRQHFRSIEMDGFTIQYREAGSATSHTILLLHGFPSAGHMFRDFIPMLAKHFHVIAPDMPGFGMSGADNIEQAPKSFDGLARFVEHFIKRIGVSRVVLYLFDYGAPIGLRFAMRFPSLVDAIILQGGSIHVDGLPDSFQSLRDYWSDPQSPQKRDALRALLEPQAITSRYSDGVNDLCRLSPDGQTLDLAYLSRPEVEELQLDLLLDYASNVALYEAFAAYLIKHQPPFLAIWGRHDPYALLAGAEAIVRTMPKAELEILETGHFALETHCGEIADRVRRFLLG